jgi:hypothetical protein
LGENHALMSGNGCLHILLMFTCIWLNSWWSFHLGEADIFTASTGKITNRNGGDFSRDLIWPMLIRESWHYSVCIYIYIIVKTWLVGILVGIKNENMVCSIVYLRLCMS